MQDIKMQISTLEEREQKTQQKINELNRKLAFYRGKNDREKRKERSHRLIVSAATMEKILGHDIDPQIAERAARVALAADSTLGREAEPDDVRRLIKLGAFIEKAYNNFAFKSEQSLKFLGRVLALGDRAYRAEKQREKKEK